ncbi:unnamed protein product, partial [marine sediment metagenome]
MNEGLIKNWNSVVETSDIVYHLGDFGFGSTPILRELLDRLNGNVILIKGNHDHYDKVRSVFPLLFQSLVLIQNRKYFALFHRPEQVETFYKD